MTRQSKRAELFKQHFETYPNGTGVPKGIQSRKERRKLARAYAAKDWNARATA